MNPAQTPPEQPVPASHRPSWSIEINHCLPHFYDKLPMMIMILISKIHHHSSTIQQKDAKETKLTHSPPQDLGSLQIRPCLGSPWSSRLGHSARYGEHAMMVCLQLIQRCSQMLQKHNMLPALEGLEKPGITLCRRNPRTLVDRMARQDDQRARHQHRAETDL